MSQWVCLLRCITSIVTTSALFEFNHVLHSLLDLYYDLTHWDPNAHHVTNIHLHQWSCLCKSQKVSLHNVTFTSSGSIDWHLYHVIQTARPHGPFSLAASASARRLWSSFTWYALVSESAFFKSAPLTCKRERAFIEAENADRTVFCGSAEASTEWKVFWKWSGMPSVQIQLCCRRSWGRCW